MVYNKLKVLSRLKKEVRKTGPFLVITSIELLKIKALVLTIFIIKLLFLQHQNIIKRNHTRSIPKKYIILIERTVKP